MRKVDAKWLILEKTSYGVALQQLIKLKVAMMKAVRAYQ